VKTLCCVRWTTIMMVPIASRLRLPTTVLAATLVVEGEDEMRIFLSTRVIGHKRGLPGDTMRNSKDTFSIAPFFFEPCLEPLVHSIGLFALTL
jgi:hypothetical protein